MAQAYIRGDRRCQGKQHQAAESDPEPKIFQKPKMYGNQAENANDHE
jgi:hypothetical protein